MSPLAQRVRRIAVVVAVLAIAAAAFGMWPDSVEVHYHISGATELMRAGGWSVVVWAVVQGLVAKLVYSDPTRRAAAAWIAGSVVIDLAGLIAWLVENFRVDARVSYGPAQLTGACASATAILVFAVLPILLVASDRTEPPDAPRARVVD
jgi:hypothetical protein